MARTLLGAVILLTTACSARHAATRWSAFRDGMDASAAAASPSVALEVDAAAASRPHVATPIEGVICDAGTEVPAGDGCNARVCYGTVWTWTAVGCEPVAPGPAFAPPPVPATPPPSICKLNQSPLIDHCVSMTEAYLAMRRLRGAAPTCRRDAGHAGAGTLVVTYEPGSGSVSSVEVDRRLVRVGLGPCLEALARFDSIAPFAGGPFRIGVHLDLDAPVDDRAAAHFDGRELRERMEDDDASTLRHARSIAGRDL